jgi:uncharacterized protein (DUF1330 family)
MVYQIIDIDVLQPTIYGRYLDRVEAVVSRHGGRYLVRGGRVRSATGGWVPGRIVIIEFDDMESLQGCYASAEYREIALLREQSTRSRTVIVEGIAGT